MALRRYKENILNKPSDELGSSPLDLTVPLPDVNPSYGRFDNNEDQQNENVEDSYYLDYVASSGSIALLEGSPRALSYKLLRNGRVLELEPVDVRRRSDDESDNDDDSSNNSKNFRKIRISSKLKIRPNCISVSRDQLLNHMVLDFITVNGFFYTVSFGFDEFISGKKSNLSDRNGPQWRSIKSPYSFDVKKPIMLHGVSSNLLVVSTNDGTMIRLDRKEPLGVITTNFLQDSGSGLSFSKLLPWNQSGKVPGKPDLSIRSAISITSTDSLVAAVSINKTLKVWSIETSSLIGEYNLASLSSGEPSKQQLLDPNPSRLLYFSKNQKYLLSYLPNEDAGKFRLWRVRNDGGGIEDLGEDFEVDAHTPDSTAVWLLCDLALQIADEGMKIWALWKSDTSSSVHSYLMPFNPAQVRSTTEKSQWQVSDFGIEPQGEFVRQSDTTSEDESEYFIRKIFGPNGFSYQTIRTALPIYGEHYGLQWLKPDLAQLDSLDALELRDQVCKTIGSAVSVENSTDGLNTDFKAYQKDLGLQWVRFSRLCAELEKQGKESLSMVLDEEDGNNTLYVVKASFLSVIRASTEMELYYNNKSTAPSKAATAAIAKLTGKNVEMVEYILRLLDALYQFRHSFSNYALYDIFVALEEDFSLPHLFLTEEREVYIYETYIENHVTEHAMGTLATALFEIPEIDSVVLELYNVLMTIPLEEHQKQTKLTHYGSQELSNSLFEFVHTAKLLVTDILIVTLMSSCQDDLIGEHTTIYAKFSTILKCLSSTIDSLFIVPEKSRKGNKSSSDSYNAMVAQVSNLSFQKPSHIAHSAEKGSSFVEALVFDTYTTSALQIWGKFNELLNPTAHAEIAVELFKRGYKNQLLEYMSRYMGHDSFSTFIRGNLLLGYGKEQCRKAVTLLRKASVGISVNGLSDDEVKIASRLNDLYKESDGINSLWSYFYAVSAVASSFGRVYEAVEFIKLAERNGSAIANDDEQVQIYSALFDRALNAHYFDDAYAAIIEISFLETGSLLTMVEKLVSVMVQNGRGDRLCEYPFIGISDMVTDFLEKKTRNIMIDSSEINNHEPKNSIPYYKVLYGWYIERGNFRDGKFCFHLFYFIFILF